MSTVVADMLSDLQGSKCYMADLALGVSKAWVTININSSTLTLNTAYNVSSVQDIAAGQYKGLSSVSLPGSNGSRAVGAGHATNLDATGFNYHSALYDGTAGASGIRISVNSEVATVFVHGVIY